MKFLTFVPRAKLRKLTSYVSLVLGGIDKVAGHLGYIVSIKSMLYG